MKLLPIGTKITHGTGYGIGHGLGVITGYNTLQPNQYVERNLKDAAELAGKVGLLDAVVDSFYNRERCPYIVEFVDGYKDVYEYDSIRPLKNKITHRGLELESDFLLQYDNQYNERETMYMLGHPVKIEHKRLYLLPDDMLVQLSSNLLKSITVRFPDQPADKFTTIPLTYGVSPRSLSGPVDRDYGGVEVFESHAFFGEQKMYFEFIMEYRKGRNGQMELMLDIEATMLFAETMPLRIPVVGFLPNFQFMILSKKEYLDECGIAQPTNLTTLKGPTEIMARWEKTRNRYKPCPDCKTIHIW